MKASNVVKKYVKKDLKQNKPLKDKFEEAFQDIMANPFTVGERKKGDLSDVYTYKFKFAKSEYRIAYVVKMDRKGEYILYLLAGTHENFYKDLKKYWNN